MNKLENIKDIISSMTLEEKAKLVNGATFFGSAAIERLDIPRMQLLDGGTGMNFEQLFGDMTQVFNYSDENMIGSSPLINVIDSYYEPERLEAKNKELHDWISDKLEGCMMDTIGTTDYAPGCFPPGILLGSTWNKDTVKKVGQALGIEGCIFGVHMLLGTPNVNIHRDPLNGRLFEGYSEDPCLVSKLAPELVKGVQEYGVIANVKHFAANNQETNRVGINETISPRALEEIYLLGFKACVTEGNVKTVMSAYNKINGIPCTESTWLLGDKLRKEWGFNGFVVSDWGAVANPVKALAGGNDLVMPGPHEWESVYNAVKDGTIPEEALDTAVENILNVIDWLCENYKDSILEYIKENPLYENDSRESLEQIKAFTDDAAYEAAAEGIVMLKNNGTYPLPKGKSIILAGSGTKRLMECGAGSAGINTNRVGDFIGELKSIYGEANVYEADCIETIDSLVNDITGGYRAGYKDEITIIIVCTLGGMEGNDRKDLYLSKEDLELINNCPYNKSIILNTCGPVDMSFDNDSIDAIWCMFLPGMGGAKAMADIISGKVNPSGKLPITFPARYEDTPTYLNFPGDGWNVNYGEGIYVGYRYYDKKKIKPKYHFGYGLSYTTFDVEITTYDMFLDYNFEAMTIKDKMDINVKVTNTGDMAGAEVIQLYIRDYQSTLPKPVKELKDFAKVYLKPGESKEITFTLDKSMFSAYDSDLGEWIAEEGYYYIIFATSSDNSQICDRMRVYLDTKSPYSYSINSSIKVIYDNDSLREWTKALWSQFGMDVAMLDNDYQYTAHRKLSQVLADVSDSVADEEKKKKFVEIFNQFAGWNIIKF
ncbi:MAG: glycoside hydrolase family 3 C-terminal domain-containing protein [Lachnospiraceae bacterium]|nr:glycoside hydrolase family 3 C-terminal domain-containing protein [Lachnospiraceae bacterium]